MSQPTIDELLPKRTPEDIQRGFDQARAAIKGMRMDRYRRLVAIELEMKDLQAEKDVILAELEYDQEADE